MSNHLRLGAVARISSSKVRERSVAVADRSEEYMPNSTTLAAEALVVRHPRPKAGQRMTPGRRRHTRSIWLLVGWLVVSVSMIACAGGVIAKYF